MDIRLLAARFLLVVVLTGPCLAAELSTQEQVGLLNDALRAFDRGTQLSRQSPVQAKEAFCEAAALFEQLVDAGVQNGRLYYNLGNARLRCGQTGLAIAAYRRAERFIPNDARLKENLRYARSLSPYDIRESGERTLVRTILFWHYDTSLRQRFLAGLVAYVLFWSCTIGRTWWRRREWRYPIGVLLLTWVTLSVSVWSDWRSAASPGEGVIVANDVVVRKGNGTGYEPQFEQTLSEGIEFDILEQRNDWLHIRLADGKGGWIRTRDAELI